MNNARWSIWFDVEGFSSQYRIDESKALESLAELMKALYLVGTTIFTRAPDRLFVHQFGDGFIVVSDFPEERPDRPIAICLAVMRYLITKNVVTKVAISGGSFADIASCYPREVLSATADHRHVKLGEGLMTIMPVMGTALIAAHKLASQSRGAVLLLDPLVFAGVPDGVTVRSDKPIVIDWLHSNFARVDQICGVTGLDKVDDASAESKLRDYVDNHRMELSREWITSTFGSVGIRDRAS